MAYAKKSNNFKAYVQIALQPDMVAEIQAIVLDPSGIVQAVGELILAGFTLKISYEGEKQYCQVAALQMGEMSPDEGYGYYSTGETPEQAIASCYAKWRFLVRGKIRLSDLVGMDKPKLS